MEKNQTSVTSATLHQFELTIFGGISNAQFKKSYKCDFEEASENAQFNKSNRCDQCNFASIQADNLRSHLKTHSLKKSNKCDQCDFASIQADNLRRPLKTHNGDK